MKKLVLLVATGLYSGYFPIVSGTFGTIPAWIIAWYMPVGLGLMAAVALVTTIISVWSAGAAEQFLGHDSKKIVIDEWAGMFIAVIGLPHHLGVYIAAFIFFRFFDVIKPFPSGYCERWPRGWGITFDDVFAGLYANLCCWGSVMALYKLQWFGFETIFKAG